MDEILELAKELNELYEISYKHLRVEVNNIIKNRITDKHIIEKCLDELLNIPTDKCYELLKLLCEYYSLIDKDSAKFYLETFDEMYGDDDWKDIKK